MLKTSPVTRSSGPHVPHCFLWCGVGTYRVPTKRPGDTNSPSYIPCLDSPVRILVWAGLYYLYVRTTSDCYPAPDNHFSRWTRDGQNFVGFSGTSTTHFDDFVAAKAISARIALRPLNAL